MLRLRRLPAWAQRALSDRAEENVIRTLFYLLKETNLTYKDLCEMPVPAIFMLADELEAHAKREERAMRKK